MQSGGGESEMQQNRRLKPLQAENQNQNQNQQLPPPQPQKCPRCDSMNTKFCYYNNYSLTQPRYFCKTCRRYWTQGGTLRNVPVGGGCRKGKRIKISSSSGDSSRSNQSQSQIPNSIMAINPGLRLKDGGIGNLASQSPQISSFYHSHGFLSSLAAVQSMHQPSGFNPSFSIGTDPGGGSSNLGMFQGYKTLVPSYGLQQPLNLSIPQTPQTQFYFGEKATDSMYPIEPKSELTQQQQNWQQNFVANANTTAISDTSLWSMNCAANAAATTSNTNNNTSSSDPQTQWSDLSGYGAPPS